MRLDRIIAVRNDKTVYKDRNRCLKVFRSGYSKADVLSEALNQARAEQAGIPVPKIREIAVIDGKWTIALAEYVRSEKITPFVQKLPSFGVSPKSPPKAI